MKIYEWKKVVCIFNMDMVGKKGRNEISVIRYYTDDRLMESAQRMVKKENKTIIKTVMPEAAGSDFMSFRGQNFGKEFVFSFQ